MRKLLNPYRVTIGLFFLLALIVQLVEFVR